ncbi:MAG: NAD(+)/NADH kinase [Thermoleophilaceae bacterium]|nr:NAD(+)/NADH kinase [Thermoleophilaceae bacterium]
MTRPGAVEIFTHAQPAETAEALRQVVERLRAEGVRVLLSREEADKHALPDGLVEVGDGHIEEVDLALVLGGDGTILRAMRTHAGRDVPVFAFNFGAIGFLATLERGELEQGIEHVLAGDYELLPVPALSIDAAGAHHSAINDISFHRRPNGRVAELAYSVEGEQLGRVRCDGLVVSTPVGSTGYNLANGGPVLAWGVDGFVVSFIAPHTLTARALVVATDAVMTVQNCSSADPVDVTTDGRIVCPLRAGEEMHVRFMHDRALLAQLPGSNFYHRLREKFGRLAS